MSIRDFFSGLNTTAGSFSLLKSVVPSDAGVVKRLRAAGAIILGDPDLLLSVSFYSTGSSSLRRKSKFI